MGHTPIIQRLRKPVPPEMLAALKQRFDDRFSVAHAIREHHGRDESPYPDMLPDAVVYAQSTEDVVFVVKACAEHGIALIPYGAGSSLEGHLLAIEGGISLDVSGMNKVVALNTEDLTVTVQPGMTRKQLNEYLRDTGLFFPIDPGADASLGGMASTRASGTNAVRYGTMRENVLGLEVVTAQGKVIRTASRARKSSAGYDLTRLFVGSEGTLGVITEVTVRLYPQPEAVSAAVCHFKTVQDAVATVIQTIQLGVPVARVELMDANAVKASNAYSKLTLRETPLLLFEFHGSPMSRNSRVTMAGWILSGPSNPRIEIGFGPRGTMHTLPGLGFVLGVGPVRQMFVFPFHVWVSVLMRPPGWWLTRRFRPRLLGTWVMAIFMC